MANKKFKNPQLGITFAIKQQFLTGYSESNCFVLPFHASGREDMAYNTAVINVYRSPTDTESQLDAKLAKCPKGYTESGRGIMYFMVDTKHPNKLLFVRIGQSNIPSGVGPMCQGRARAYHCDRRKQDRCQTGVAHRRKSLSAP